MLNRSLAPAVQEISAVQLPSVEVSTFPNGSRIHTIYNNTQPVIKLEIVLKAGKWYEPFSGISYLTAKMLLEGTKSYTSKQIADIIAFYGASLECNHGFDRSSVTLYCLNKHFEPLVQLFAEVLLSPVFPEKEFDLLKTRTLQNISIEKKKNAYLANQFFTRNVYGSGHPYVTGMDEETLSQVLINNVKEFYSQYYSLAQAEIFLCGAFSSQDMSFITTLFGHQTSTVSSINNTHHTIDLSKLIRKDFIEKTDSLQSSVRVGGSWPSFKHPDYHLLSFLNKVLGGYFGSRLMKNIREDKGYTYGIYSTISIKEHHAIFLIATDVNYKNTEHTLQEIYKEMNLLKTELISENELSTVRNYALGKLANDLSTLFDQSERYKNIVLHGLPHNFYTDYIHAIKEVHPETLLLLANQYYSENFLFEAVVGKRFSE